VAIIVNPEEELKKIFSSPLGDPLVHLVASLQLPLVVEFQVVEVCAEQTCGKKTRRKSHGV
jgi:hypothetical protein